MPALTHFFGEEIDGPSFMSRETGQRLSEIDHLRQSIIDILTTPIGSRVMRRDYGSNLFKLIDRNIDRVFMLELYHSTAEALNRWEPRLRLNRVSADLTEWGNGVVTLTLEGWYLIEGRAIRLTGLTLNFFSR